MGFPLLDVIGIGAKLIDKIIPDKGAAAEAKLKLLELQQTGELAQLTAETDLAKGQQDINKVEAASSSIFVAGWRPALGWVCASIFAANYIGEPILAWLSPLLSLPPPPRLDMGEVYPVLLGMLGLGGLRTAEKMKGVAA